MIISHEICQPSILYVFLIIILYFRRGLEESMPHLRVLLGHQGALDIAGGESGAVKLRWKFLLSNLVRAISSHSHPIALLFEDLHWADDDTFGEHWKSLPT